MENEIYEKDYGEEFRERSDKSEGKDFLDTLMEVGFFQKYQEEMNKIPKRVVPKEKADYEYLLGECDAYVRQFGGRIRGEVDYQKWQATIDLYLDHFEFCDREALTLLKEIAERAENVTFSMKDGLIRMPVFIGYFDEVYYCVKTSASVTGGCFFLTDMVCYKQSNWRRYEYGRTAESIDL